jgi:hypothetical protein
MGRNVAEGEVQTKERLSPADLKSRTREYILPTQLSQQPGVGKSLAGLIEVGAASGDTRHGVVSNVKRAPLNPRPVINYRGFAPSPV